MYLAAKFKDMDLFVGREHEVQLLEKIYKEERSSFVAIYGRRRIGKTFLVRRTIGERMTFHLTAIGNVTTEQQLANFQAYFERKVPLALHRPMPKNWFSAFQQLITFLEKSPAGKKVIFLDELPWFDTPKSDFMASLEHFWNSWASAREDIMLIVCGSAASWMLHKLIHNHGGLHNRVTTRMRLDPFTLREAEILLKQKNNALDRYQIIQYYMAVGGVPFYLDTFDGALTPMQNIENQCFAKDGFLRTEFQDLFQSLFAKSEKHISIVEAIATKAKGLTREDILKITKLPNNGATTRLLEELEESGFIIKYQPFQKTAKHSLFQLIDFYTLFYLRFIKNTSFLETGNWLALTDSLIYKTWCGYAFEQVCLMHVPQIKQALGISGVFTQSAAWRSAESENGTQIDLLIDRRDRIINLFEIKFSAEPYVITKAYAEKLRHKVGTFKSETATTKAVWLAMLTTFGTKQNEYSGSLLQHNLDMNCLFS